MSNLVRSVFVSLVLGSAIVAAACAAPIGPDEGASTSSEQAYVQTPGDDELCGAGDAGAEKPFPGCKTPIPVTQDNCKALGNDNNPPIDKNKPTCLGTHESIDEQLRRSPGSCNRLALPDSGPKKWSECRNQLFLACLDAGFLGNGTVWTTGPWPPPKKRQITCWEYLYCKANEITTTPAPKATSSTTATDITNAELP